MYNVVASPARVSTDADVNTHVRCEVHMQPLNTRFVLVSYHYQLGIYYINLDLTSHFCIFCYFLYIVAFS